MTPQQLDAVVVGAGFGGIGAAIQLRRLGYDNTGIHIGDGSLGWPVHAPYDKIIVTAAAKLVPPALLQQLKPGCCLPFWPRIRS